MASGSYHAVVRHVRRLFHLGTVAGLGEGELLERYVTRGDPAAFEAILARHGPMVLGVCRQLLRDPHAVEDAFQATFLVLVRKAGSLRRPDLLGPWLYGVAHRVAVRARRQAGDRPGLGPDIAEKEKVSAPCPLEGLETRAAIHDEVNRLPEKYRTPIVLCYLEGLTHVEAAERLGWPVGTVRGRLARGRDILRDRLTRRGLMLSAGVVGAAPFTADAVSVPPPEALTAAVAEAAARTARGFPLAGSVSARAVALTEGVIHAMLWNKLKPAAVLLLAATALAAATGALAQNRAGTSGPAQPKPPVAAPTPATPEPSRALIADNKPAKRDDGSRPEPPDPDQLAEQIDRLQADTDLLELEVEANKGTIRELQSQLMRRDTLDDPSDSPRLSKQQREEIRKRAGERRQRNFEHLEVLRSSFLERNRTLAEQKRRLARSREELERVTAAARATGDSPRPERAKDKAADGDDGELLRSLDEARLDVELLRDKVEAEHRQLLEELKTASQYEPRPGSPSPSRRDEPAPPEAADPKAVELAREQSWNLWRERAASTRKAYLSDKDRLNREERRLAELEKKAGRDAIPVKIPAEVSRRLEAVEEKLDRLLKALEGSKAPVSR